MRCLRLQHQKVNHSIFFILRNAVYITAQHLARSKRSSVPESFSSVSAFALYVAAFLHGVQYVGI